MPSIKPNIPEFVLFILERLKGAGHQAFVVGGALRNAAFQRTITDWDVATSASTREIKTIFSDVKFFSLKHGTVTLVHSKQHFDVTPFRGKSCSLKDDLARRDFTMNAMALDPENIEIIDPFDGQMDIQRKQIRAVGNPKIRFQEDPLRLLRAVRLATELRFKIEVTTLEAMPYMAPFLQKVAAERIREEFTKILMSPIPSSGFNLMRRTGVLKQFLPELLEGYRKQQNPHHRYTIYRHIIETIDRVEPALFLRLTALFHDIAKPRVRKKIEGKWRFLDHDRASAVLAAEILNRLRYSHLLIARVINLIRHHMIGYNSRWSDAAVRRLIRRVGPENILDLIRFRRSDILAHGLHKHRLDSLNELEARIKKQMQGPLPTKTRQLAINGQTVMEILSLPEGPEVGRMLQLLMEKVIDHPEQNTKSRLICMLNHMRAPNSL